MQSFYFDVAGVTVECQIDDPSVIVLLDATFDRTLPPAQVFVAISVDPTTGDTAIFDWTVPRLQVTFSAFEDLDGYGYHNATKWLLRAAAWVWERRGVVCLHASGVIWHGCGLMIAGGTLRTGKTTLSLSIAKCGGQFVGDEYLFFDGHNAYGCHRFRSYLRLGSLLLFDELRHLVPTDLSTQHDEIWNSDFGLSVNVSELFGPAGYASVMRPSIVLLSRLSPTLSTSIQRLNPDEAISVLRLEAMKHVSKLWLSPGEELNPEEVDRAVERLRGFGLEPSVREKVVSLLAHDIPCFSIEGGSDFDELLVKIECLAMQGS